MARNKKVIALLREGLREKDALNNTYKQRIDVFYKHVNNLFEQSKAMHDKDPSYEIIDRRRMSRDEIIEYIPTYIEERRLMGRSEDTLHTDLAALCKALDISMTRFETIHRGQPTKGRGENSLRVRTEENSRVIEFAERVGIRKNEYKELKGEDFIKKGDYYYVVVKSGKGGKRQEQLICPSDVEIVKSYFEGKDKSEYIFSLKEIEACQHANLHEIRRQHAQEMYQYYSELLKDPEEREKMKDLLEKRFDENPKKIGKFDRDLMDKPYVCRGSVRDEIIEQGKPYTLDRLSLIATSNLHLAHYRPEVFTRSYYK